MGVAASDPHKCVLTVTAVELFRARARAQSTAVSAYMVSSPTLKPLIQLLMFILSPAKVYTTQLEHHASRVVRIWPECRGQGR